MLSRMRTNALFFSDVDRAEHDGHLVVGGHGGYVLAAPGAGVLSGFDRLLETSGVQVVVDEGTVGWNKIG